MATLRLGAIPSDPAKPRVRLTAHLRPVATAPASADFSKLTAIGMLGNDEWGDCTEAANGHIVELLTYYGLGRELQVTAAQVLTAYTRVTGFNPLAGPPGRNPTDNGAQVIDVLADFVTSGVADFRLSAYAEVNVGDPNEVKLAVADFGCLSIAVDLPASAQQQFYANKPWTVKRNDGGIAGGHCIVPCGYDESYVYAFTWGAVVKIAWAWWRKYVTEAWAVVSQAANATRTDLVTLGTEFAAITSQPDPFPA